MQLSVRVKYAKRYTCDVTVNAESLWSSKAATDLMYSLGKSVRMPDIGLKPYILCGSGRPHFVSLLNIYGALMLHQVTYAAETVSL